MLMLIIEIIIATVMINLVPVNDMRVLNLQATTMIERLSRLSIIIITTTDYFNGE